MQPKVTIAVPVYGVEKYIAKCANSLFSQNYNNIEFLFIDDCSPDNSINVVMEVLTNYPNREKQVRIIHQKINKGCPAARNLAVKLASGEFIFNVDADDYIEPDAISALVEKQQENDVDLVVGNYLIETQWKKSLVRYCDIKKTREEIVIDCLDDKTSQSVWGILIRKKIYTDNDIKAEESFHVGEDWQVAPLLLFYAKKIDYIDKIIYHYQLSRPNSITISSQESVTKKKNQIICFVKTMNCLLNSFEDKGQKYLDIIYRKKTCLLQDALIYSCKDHDKDTFRTVAQELKNINPKYYEVLGSSNYISLMLKRNYYFMSLFLYFFNHK